MKYVFIVLLAGLIPQTDYNKEVVRDYVGGRRGYIHRSLKLYENSQYLYTEWIHTRYSLRDSGTYVLMENEIRLTSLETKVTQGGLDRRRQRKFERIHRNYKHFDGKSFLMENDKIRMYDIVQLKDARRYDLFYFA